jgi:hypothetical protein
MPDRNPQPPASSLGIGATWRGLRLLDVGELLGRWRPTPQPDHGSDGGFGAGYRLRRRQETNRARLACPACRAQGGSGHHDAPLARPRPGRPQRRPTAPPWAG